MPVSRPLLYYIWMLRANAQNSLSIYQITLYPLFCLTLKNLTYTYKAVVNRLSNK